MSKHTPGPCKVTLRVSGTAVMLAQIDSMARVQWVKTRRRGRGIQSVIECELETAREIASILEYYGTASGLDPEFSKHAGQARSEAQRTRAAIAKAEGEG